MYAQQFYCSIGKSIKEWQRFMFYEAVYDLHIDIGELLRRIRYKTIEQEEQQFLAASQGQFAVMWMRSKMQKTCMSFLFSVFIYLFCVLCVSL